MRKRIVFHFYYNKSLINNVMYHIHHTCLSRYSCLFNDAIFNIVLDNINDESSFNEAKEYILSTGFKEENTVFYLNENTEMRDSQTFYDYVIKELGSYDGITFFGHSKGLTNMGKSDYMDENVIYWVVAMYYFNLENICEFEKTQKIAYLNPFIDNSEYIEKKHLKDEPKYGYYPVGTFFLIKDQSLVEYINKNNVTLPDFKDRFYAEKFIGNVIPLDFELLDCYGETYGMGMDNLYKYGKINITSLYNRTDKWPEYKELVDTFLKINRKRTIQIIYLSTDKYKNYAEKFFSTLPLFFPEYKKYVTVVTDDTKMLETIAMRYANDMVSFEFHIMPGNCPYPCVNLSKFAYVDAFIGDYYDYIFYFDSDTYFIQRDDIIWEYTISLMEEDNVLLGYHPGVLNSIAYPEDKESIKLSINLCDERPESKIYNTWGIKDPDYIWVITSFFCAKHDIMRKFVKKANENVINAMRGPKLHNITEYYVPRLFDETIANKMIYDFQQNKDKSIKFNINSYVINIEGYLHIFPNILCIQKYDVEENYKNHD